VTRFKYPLRIESPTSKTRGNEASVILAFSSRAGGLLFGGLSFGLGFIGIRGFPVLLGLRRRKTGPNQSGCQ
jgi:hypothetical protein